MSEPVRGFCVVEAATGDELELSMQQLFLRGRILPVGARLLVQHVFQAAGKKPVEAVYAFALPRDAALRRFTIRGDRFAVHSELQPTKDAQKNYENAIEQGSLAALARQHGDGIVNLTVGNIRPGETVTVSLEILAGVESRDDGFRFRFPFTLAPSYHKRARMLEVEPGSGEIELPEDEFGDVLLPRFLKDASHLHGIGFDLRIDSNTPLREISSPSHGIRVSLENGGARVALSKEKDVPDRDLVLEAKRPLTAEILAGKASDERLHYIALIPSSLLGQGTAAPRRVVFVLDRSGSMQGLPIQQARRALDACLGALEPSDQFGIVAFDDRVEPFRPGLTDATRANRDEARRFFASIDARGGTDVSPAISHAATLLNGGGDVVFITDGQVFGTETIIALARRTGLRLHTMGIGSASQDRFLSLLARETGGVSHFVTAEERVDLAMVNLFASVGRPIASDVEIAGALASRTVFAGTPLVAYGESTEQSIAVKWTGGALEFALADAGRRLGETVRLLHGARLLTDLDCRGETEHLREASAAYGLASREMSLVAVVKRESDRAGEPPKTVIVPVGMAQNTEFESYFHATRMMAAMPSAPTRARMAKPSTPRRFLNALSKMQMAASAPPMQGEVMSSGMFMPAAQPADPLFEIASTIEDDGGMPGTTPDERVRRTLHAILCLLQEGHSSTTGAFRSHVQRLTAFVSAQIPSLGKDALRTSQSILEATRTGVAPKGNWVKRWSETLGWAELPQS